MSTATVGARVPSDRRVFIASKCAARGQILIAGMGTSPAVLTETVWALAHQEHPVVPDEIVVITTKSGKEALRTAVMSGASRMRGRNKNTTGFVHFVLLVPQCSKSVNISLSRVKCWILKGLYWSYRKAA